MDISGVTMQTELNNPYFEIKELSDKKVFLKQKTGGVILVPKFKRDYLLISIERYGSDKAYLEFPRGFAEVGETLERAAIREFKEELGVEPIGVSKWLGNLKTDLGLIDDNVAAFELTVADTQKVVVQKNEGLKAYSFVTESELERLIRENVIVDNFTIAAYFLSKLKS